MLSRLRHAPGLASRSNLEFGGIASVAAILFLALALSVVERKYTTDPPLGLLAALAGVSGTLFVAYSVVASSAVGEARVRGRELEYRLGAMIGIGLCAVVGIGLALLLMEARTPLDWPHRVALCWAGTSAVFLAVAVALSLGHLRERSSEARQPRRVVITPLPSATAETEAL